MNFLKNKKKKVQEVQPRQMNEINKDYAILVAKLGQTSYQKFVLEREEQRLNAALLQINNEGAVRQKLDQDAAKQDAKSEQVQ